MKKKLLSILFLLLSVFGLKLNANAAPSTITTASLGKGYTVISGTSTVYIKQTTSGIYLYCEEANKKFPANMTLKLKGTAPKGMIYILKNKPNTGNVGNDYYIMQTAVWWYKDVWSGTNNLSQSAKNTLTNLRNTNAIAGKIYNLVEGAKNYSEVVGSIKLSGTNNFTISGSNYVSDVIKVTKMGLATYDLQLIGAPSGAKIINKTNTSFQVSVPVSSVSNGQTISFEVKASGSYDINTAYEYEYGSGYQSVLYEKYDTEHKTVSDSIKFSITKPNENALNVYKVDEKGNAVSGAKLALYKGDCSSTTCAKTNLYQSWTSTNSPKTFVNISKGTYTLVEEEAPNGYKLAAKQKVSITSLNGTFRVTMVDNKITTTKVKISKTDITESKELPGATLVVKDASGSVIDKWTSTNEAHYVTVNPGVYTLSETVAPKGYKLTTTTITFKVDEDLNIYELKDGKYVSTDHIKMVNELLDKSAIKINKLDSKTNEYVSGAILMIKNNKGETVATITTTNSASYITLDEGEYVLSEEAAPNGYEKTDAKIYFSVDEEGKIKIKGSSGYVDAVELTIYNQKEEAEIIVVPTTGLSSTLTYVVGTLVVSAGAVMLYRNGKQN